MIRHPQYGIPRQRRYPKTTIRKPKGRYDIQLVTLGGRIYIDGKPVMRRIDFPKQEPS